MRSNRIALAVLGLLFAGQASAAGTVTVTTADVGGGNVEYTVAWTSTAGGAVSANTFSVQRGRLRQVQFIPGTGGTQPTDLYDVTLVETNSVDLLNDGTTAQGGNLSNATSKILTFANGYYSKGVSLDVVVANAGNAKTGSVVIVVGP